MQQRNITVPQNQFAAQILPMNIAKEVVAILPGPFFPVILLRM